MKIGKAIRKLRKAQKLSQVKLGAMCKVPQNVISRLERDIHQPREKTLLKIAKALSVDPDAFYQIILNDKAN